MENNDNNLRTKTESAKVKYGKDIIERAETALSSIWPLKRGVSSTPSRNKSGRQNVKGKTLSTK